MFLSPAHVLDVRNLAAVPERCRIGPQSAATQRSAHRRNCWVSLWKVVFDHHRGSAPATGHFHRPGFRRCHRYRHWARTASSTTAASIFLSNWNPARGFARLSKELDARNKPMRHRALRRRDLEFAVACCRPGRRWRAGGQAHSSIEARIARRGKTGSVTVSSVTGRTLELIAEGNRRNPALFRFATDGNATASTPAGRRKPSTFQPRATASTRVLQFGLGGDAGDLADGEDWTRRYGLHLTPATAVEVRHQIHRRPSDWGPEQRRWRELYCRRASASTFVAGGSASAAGHAGAFRTSGDAHFMQAAAILSSIELLG